MAARSSVVEIVMEETGELPLAVVAMAGLGDGLLGHDEEKIQVRGYGGAEHARAEGWIGA